MLLIGQVLMTLDRLTCDLLSTCLVYEIGVREGASVHITKSILPPLSLLMVKRAWTAPLWADPHICRSSCHYALLMNH